MTITKRKITFIAVVLCIYLLQLSFIFYWPNSNNAIPVNWRNLQGLSVWMLLTNPVIQFLLCITVSIMLVSFEFVMHTDAVLASKKASVNRSVSYARIIGAFIFSILSILIYLTHLAYFHTYFLGIISQLFYLSYNPSAASALSVNYYQWRYGLTAPGIVVALIVGPIFIPFFYYLRKKVRQLQS
jgi:hypothetical protein